MPVPVRLLVLALLLGAAAIAGARADQAEGLAERLAALGGAPCADSGLTCVTLALPHDHEAGDNGPTVEVTFAVSPATLPSLGTLFYAVGGPGGSGLAVAEDYLAAYDPELVAALDIVFFDQRGVGPVHGVACPVAEAAFYLAELPVERPEVAIAAARDFVAACTAETGDTTLLPFVATQAAARDLELFRAAIGSPAVWVYGESYGTQLAQTYATMFPAAVRGVILDGVVDLTLGFEAFYADYTVAAERLLVRTLAACETIAACAADMEGDALAAYDALAARLAEGPLAVEIGGGDAPVERHELTAAMLENSAFYALYGPDGRASFLRALAAASRGELAPMLRLAYADLSLDLATGAPVFDPTWYGGAYYAINCADYATPGATPGASPEAVAAAIMAEAQALAANAPRLPRAYFAERLACAFWPVAGGAERPAPFAGGDYPTLVLTSDADPITPPGMAQSVFDHVRNGYLVTMEGGPHVIWGRGLDCPDRIVADLLTAGQLPEAPVQLCTQELVAGYVPLTLTTPEAAADPLALARAVETELWQSWTLYMWDGESALATGCDHGGSITVAPGETGTDFTFTGCALWPGTTVDGSGSYVEYGEAGDGLTLDLAVAGAHGGAFVYRSGSLTGAATIEGTWDGAAFTTPRPAP